MLKLKSKIIIIAIVSALLIIGMQVSIYATTNESIEIVKKGHSNYLIYVKDNLNKEFSFAFSNNADADKATLTFKEAETDSSSSDANKIAYVDSTTIALFDQPTYIWVKDSEENYILSAVQIDLNKSISETDFNSISKITKIIPVDTTEKNEIIQEVDGKKITTTVGKVVLKEPTGKYSYIIVKLPDSAENNNLMNVATKISKFNNQTDMYTKINMYRIFKDLLDDTMPDNDANWIKVQENEIEQPSDTENGTKYILWIKQESGRTTKYDVQFLTSTKEVSEEKAIVEITTKLPVTYDNNKLLIVLAVLVLATIIVCVRIRTLSKKEK